MDRLPVCDFCGRPGTVSQGQDLEGQRELELGQDGLWVCSECKTRLVGDPSRRAFQSRRKKSTR